MTKHKSKTAKHKIVTVSKPGKRVAASGGLYSVTAYAYPPVPMRSGKPDYNAWDRMSTRMLTSTFPADTLAGAHRGVRAMLKGEGSPVLDDYTLMIVRPSPADIAKPSKPSKPSKTVKPRVRK